MDNGTDKSYFLVSDDVGIWPGQEQLFGPLHRGIQKAPLALMHIAQQLCIVNQEATNCTIDGNRMQLNEATPLCGDGGFITIGDETIALTRS